MVTLAFAAASLVVIMTPGPDLALITRLGLTRRRAAPAVAAAAGMITAGAVQLAVGTMGLAALLAAEPSLFTALRWTGAAVLAVMAALALRSALRPPRPRDPQDAHDLQAAHGPRDPSGQGGVHGRAFLQGLLCTGTNPKVGVFLMAFLPQFVPPGVDPVRGVPVLGAVYLALGLLWLLTWTALVDRLARRAHTPAVARAADGLTAAVLAFFAVRLSLGS
ncbi:LysE family translocator [Sphaerisporangium sp. NPDC051011]|uniref:LysE family translocator n=1 Tax=Sphaerisporangium sp. NPDC051011 TaxID=3155792 RepID=UPI003402180C